MINLVKKFLYLEEVKKKCLFLGYNKKQTSLHDAIVEGGGERTGIATIQIRFSAKIQ